MRKIFINDFGRLRSGWRVLLFIFAFLAIFFLVATVLRAAYAVVQNVGPSFPHADFVTDAIFRVTLIISALGGGYFCVRLFEGLPWKSLGLTFHRGWLRDLLIGSAIGFVSLTIAVGIAAAAGGLTFTFGGGVFAATIRSLLGFAFLLFVAALAEEAMFRGYGLQTLTRAHLVWLAVLLTSVPFGLVHLSNPNVVPGVTFANTVLAGMWLALGYLRTRSLWFPLGLHWSWNWALGWFFGLPISGINIISNPLLKGTDVGPKWLTGGSYGIEGGVACTITLAIFTLFLWYTNLVSATPELKELTSHENPAIPSPVLSIRPADESA